MLVDISDQVTAQLFWRELCGLICRKGSLTKSLLREKEVVDNSQPAGFAGPQVP